MRGISGYGGDEDGELDEERAREREVRKGVEGLAVVRAEGGKAVTER